MQALDRPAAGDEFRRQPVEQLGVAGRLASDAEVGRRRHDSPAEMVLPDPVGHHPGRQRVIRMRQPIGELESTACCGPDGARGSPPPGTEIAARRAARRRPGCRGRRAAEAARRPAFPR